jgi:two-component system alkaline phosphatase synthesis response regulator PhoP
MIEREGGGMTNADRDEVTVLFVEDDPAFADMYRLKLEMDGYTVRLARDGEEALELLQREDVLPDLVFLDIRLPKLDGIALLQRLRGTERTRDLPVVILSNYGEEDLIRQGLQLGALEYLIKANVTPAQLSQGIEKWSNPVGIPEERRDS